MNKIHRFPSNPSNAGVAQGIFPFLKGLLAKGTSFRIGALNPKQKKTSPVLNNLKLC